jgi:hypothetical protein
MMQEWTDENRSSRFECMNAVGAQTIIPLSCMYNNNTLESDCSSDHSCVKNYLLAYSSVVRRFTPYKNWNGRTRIGVRVSNQYYRSVFAGEHKEIKYQYDARVSVAYTTGTHSFVQLLLASTAE